MKPPKYRTADVDGFKVFYREAGPADAPKGLGLSASDLLDQANAEPTKRHLREQTEQARVRGIFGAPTFFVGTEMFWGNDRLDDALLFASERKQL
jgi:2-hydroxychromene-2-carboxylate isomerase